MQRRKRVNKLWIALPVGAFIIFLFVVGIKMATMEANLEFVSEYTLPSLPGIAIPELYSGERAVAVNGRVIEGGSGKTRSIASTAKIITALMVMEKKPFSLGEKGGEIQISQEDYNIYSWYVNNNGSVTNIEIGEKISEYDALASMLLVSSNNMADITAKWAFSSIDDYLEFANTKLAEWGLKNTVVKNDASGYSESTISTPEEMAILGERVLRNPVLKEIVGMKKYSVPVAGEISNTNGVLGKQGIIGVKTGYNGAASGYCLVSGYEQSDNIVSITVLGASTRQQSFNETLDLVSYMQDNLKETELVHEGEEVGYYDAWWIKKQPIKVKENLSVLGYKEDANKAELVNGANDLVFDINGAKFDAAVATGDFPKEPNLWQRFLHVFGWQEEN